MAHELTLKNGVAEMAYCGATPWHGLGQKLAPGAPLPQWAKAAGMGWTVGRSRVRYGEPPKQHVMEDKHVLFRSDNKAPLGIVSPQYKIVQPLEVLEFFRDLIEAGGYSLETAGTLFGGKRCWALARVGEDVTIKGADRIGGFLLLTTSFDGGGSTTGKQTTICVVCNNTLSMAMGGGGDAVRVRHSTTFNAAQVKADLGLVEGSFKAFVQAAQVLSRAKLGGQAVEAQVAKLLVDTKTVAGSNALDDNVRQSQPFMKIMQLFNGAGMGAGLPGRAGTAWGVVNAVTEYVDHHARARTVDNRLANAWYGDGDKLKTAALDQMLALV